MTLHSEIWREAELPPAARDKLRRTIWEAFFGTNRAPGDPLPFSALSDDARDRLPPRLRAEYEAELAAAMDPRANRPILKPGLFA